MYVGPPDVGKVLDEPCLLPCVASAPNLGVRRLFLRATDAGRPLYLQAGSTQMTNGWSLSSRALSGGRHRCDRRTGR